MNHLGMTTMNTELVHRENNKAFTTSLVIAENCDNRSHKVVMNLLNKYKSDFEEFGRVDFKNATLQTNGGLQETTYCNLTEDQATLLITYFRNTPTVRKFKIRLVKEFRKALDEIDRLYANPPRHGIIQEKRDAHGLMMNALIDFRSEQGKETKPVHYMSENKLCNGVVTGDYSRAYEATMTNEQLILLALVRRRNESYLISGIEYNERKKRLIAFATKHRTNLITKG